MAFSTCVNKTETELEKSDPDLKVIAVLEVQLKDKFKQFEDNQKEIEDIFLQIAGTEKEYEEDFIAAEEYHDRYSNIIMKTESFMEETKLPQTIINN